MPSSRVIRVLLIAAGWIGGTAGLLGAAATFGPESGVPVAGAESAVAWQDPSRPASTAASASASASASAARSSLSAADRSLRTPGPGTAAATPSAVGSSSVGSLSVASPSRASSSKASSSSASSSVASSSASSSSPPVTAAARTPPPLPAGDYPVGTTDGPVGTTEDPPASTAPEGDTMTVDTGTTPWRDVAAVEPDSPLYAQIVHWAQTIKAREGTIVVTYEHGPDGRDGARLGSAADFRAAYRHVRSIVDEQGATNVRWTSETATAPSGPGQTPTSTPERHPR